MATDLSGQAFVPSGYLYKQVAAKSDWLKAPAVVDIYSVSTCMSPAFADYIPHWKHNGFWLFDIAETMRPIAAAVGIDLSGFRLFYYETYGLEYDERDGRWDWFEVRPEPSMPVMVQAPAIRQLHGYDVVTCYAGTSPECSPLSCNGLAAELPVNAHCLFASLDEAKAALEAGSFTHAEPGARRIMAVYTVG
jgi:hypothetical protein